MNQTTQGSLLKSIKPEEMGPHEHGQPTTEKSYYEGGMKTIEP